MRLILYYGFWERKVRMHDLDRLFFRISLEEFAKAWLEGKSKDSKYVKQKVYDRYEYELQQLSKNKTTDI